MKTRVIGASRAERGASKNQVKRSHDPLGDELRARALAFTDEIVNEAGVVLVKGMRGELPGSDAREQRLCAQAIRGERVASASSLPTTAPKVVVQIASFAQIRPAATSDLWRNGHSGEQAAPQVWMGAGQDGQRYFERGSEGP